MKELTWEQELDILAKGIPQPLLILMKNIVSQEKEESYKEGFKAGYSQTTHISG